MADRDPVRRVGMLAPMTHELEPIVRQLEMQPDGEHHRGRVGGVEVVAMLTTIGMAAGAQAAERMLDLGVDWMMVVGIAGGVDRSITIGDVVVPEVTVDRATGGRYRPSPLGDIAPRGTISCGDELLVDPEVLDRMAEEGVVAVDMETAAVGAVCEREGCSWSAFRGISDFAGDGLVDEALFALTRPDGTSDPDAIARYFEENPERVQILTQLARDMTLATEAAAAAAIRACAIL